MLEGTIEGEQARELCSIYEKLDQAISEFLSCYDIHCKSGCGTCCEHFVPDITEAEANYLALYIIENKREEEVLGRFLDFSEDKKGPCPLYNKDSAFHCSVYQARPLICRLFGSTCFVNKEDKPIFRHCKWNDNHKDLSSSDITTEVPVMGKYGLAVENVIANHSDTRLLPDAVTRAIFKMSLLIRYNNGGNDDNTIGA